MPYVGGGDEIHSARKRRWDDDDDDAAMYRLYNPGKQHQPEIYLLDPSQDYATARKILPLSTTCSSNNGTKRARIAPEDDTIHHHTSFVPTHRRRTSSPHQKMLQDQPLLGSKALCRPDAALLAPCYICHRRPTRKSALDSFAGCEGCGERVCFVCIRQCHGRNADDDVSVISEQEVLSRSFSMNDMSPEPQQDDSHRRDERRYHVNPRPLVSRQECENGAPKYGNGWIATGHQAVVCSRCCVERGRQGEVVCLGCLSSICGA